MLKIEHLTKTYGGKPAVQDLCLHIRPGELCAFIGHNGAGKTTTLKCCCGIQQFDAGEIYVDGISVRENPLECKRRLAYLPDDPQLYEYMTGIKYLDFIADIFGVSAAQRTQRSTSPASPTAHARSSRGAATPRSARAVTGRSSNHTVPSQRSMRPSSPTAHTRSGRTTASALRSAPGTS